MANTVTMSLEKYDEIMAWRYLVESLIVVKQSYVGSGYISLEWNAEVVEPLIRERLAKLPYGNKFVMEEQIYYSSTTVARREQEDPEE